MTALRRRFPFALELRWEPDERVRDDGATYAARTRGRSDLQVAELFVSHVRTAPEQRERDLLREALETARRGEVDAA